MGLDMYLEVRGYVSKMDYSDRDNPKTTPEFQALVDASGINDLTKYSEFAGISISYPVGYWRKANAIHGWFVQNVQGGTDDCGSYYVPREKLVELRDLCAATIKEPAMAGDILPPTQGFFFGTYEIDEWYMRDMEYTVEMIDHLLSVLPGNEWDYPIYYHSSW
jgi:hypothetical protein